MIEPLPIAKPEEEIWLHIFVTRLLADKGDRDMPSEVRALARRGWAQDAALLANEAIAAIREHQPAILEAEVVLYDNGPEGPTTEGPLPDDSEISA